MKWCQAIFAALGLLLMVGCIPIRTNGTTHYLVLGVGVVSVNNTNQYAASVTKANVLGGYVSEHGGGIGYSSEQRIMVSTNVNMDIEVSKVPFKPMKVNVK
jgi:hypothetical protein